MSRSIALRILTWGLPALLTVVLAGPQRELVAQQEKADADAQVAKQKREFRGRLPNFYRLVVGQKQREAIYEIQRQYAPKIAALRAQLDAMIKERDEKIAAVLTPEQLKRVEQARAAARARRQRASDRPSDSAPKQDAADESKQGSAPSDENPSVDR